MSHISPYFIPGTRLGNHLFALAAAYAYALQHELECRVPWDETESSMMLHEFLEDVLPSTADGKNEKIIYNEPQFSYMKFPDNLRNGSLKGIYHSPKYFDYYKDKIRTLFAPFIAEKEEGTLGIHIRLGDYMSSSDFFYVTNSTYLKNIKNQLPPNIRKVVLFTDSPMLLPAF